MATVLDKIAAYKREEIADAKSRRSFQSVSDAAHATGGVRSFRGALESRIRERRPALIAEIKKASPSKGLIREDFDPAALATAYRTGGAACLSVLTDVPSFQGHPSYLVAARTAVELPVLRKDFILDVYQVPESRAMGADCILIIMACVDDALASELHVAAAEFGMDALVEVHDEAEMERASALRPALLGINNRNLKTFETTLETTQRLAPHAPEGALLVSESGIFRPDDIAQLQSYGAGAFLVGESLMRQSDVEAATRALLNVGAAKRSPEAAE